MKTLNFIYSKEKLIEVIEKNYINRYNSILIQLFFTIYDKKIIENSLNEILELLPKATIIGLTTERVIYNGNLKNNQNLISISLFEKVKINSFLIENSQIDNSFELGKELANRLTSKDEKVIITFADNLYINGEEFIKGVDEVKKEIIVTGGLINYKEEKGYLILNNQIISNGVVAILLSGELTLYRENIFNWQLVDKSMTITKSNRNRVYQIDNRDIMEVYSYYLGDEVSIRLPKIGIEFPLIISRDGIEVARTLIEKREDNSLLFMGNIKEGEKVQFGYGDDDFILDESLPHLQKFEKKEIEAIFIYSCIARKKFLGEKIVLEIRPLKDIAPTIGCFCYGNFYTFSNYQKEFLNQNMTILTMSESKEINKNLIKTFKIRDYPSKFKTLSHLIKVIANELKESNHNLEEKINREVLKNKKQFDYLLQHSRHAQMGEILSMIAHQWRQPLLAISSTVANLKIKLLIGEINEEEFYNEISQIDKTAQFLSLTINEFRDFFKPTREAEKTYFKKVIIDAIKMIQISLDKKITLIEDYRCNRKVFIYPNEMKQVILNLIKNAQDVLKEKKVEKPEIYLRTYDKDNYCYFEIEDNGGGVASDLIDKIFDPYFTTKAIDGTGLGLYMSKIIVQEHCQGELKVENRDRGAVFIIKIESVE